RLAGFPVTLSVSGDGYTFRPNPGSGGSVDMVTSGTGRITAWVSSVVAETKTITLRVGELFDLTEEVVFEPGLVSADHSDLIPSATSAVVNIDPDGEGILFEVVARDPNGNPVPNLYVRVEVSGSGNVVEGHAGSDVITDLDGRATFRLKSSRAEEKVVTIKMNDAEKSATVLFLPDVPDVARSSVDNRTLGKETTVFTNAPPFRVVVRDRYANLIQGATVTFEVTGGPDVANAQLAEASVETDENGEAEATLRVGTLSGMYEVSWHAGWEGDDPHPAKLTVLALPDVPNGIVLSNPTGDISGVAGHPVTLTFQAKDVYGNITGGADITFEGDGQPPAPASLGTWTPVNEPAAAVQWTLKTEAGTNQLTATLVEPGTGNVIDTITVEAEGTSGAPHELVIVGDSEFYGYRVTETMALADKLHVRVLDEFGNPVSGAGVEFRIVPFGTTYDVNADGTLAGPGPGEFVIFTSGAQALAPDGSDLAPGEAWTIYTLGQKAGDRVVRVSVHGSSLNDTFVIYAEPDVPAIL